MNDNLEKQLAQQVRDNIAQFLTDEKLNAIVNRAIEEAFFKPRIKEKDKYGSRDVVDPPWIHDVVVLVLQKEVKTAVAQWFVDNNDRVADTLKEFFETGISKCVFQEIDRQFTSRVQLAAEDAVRHLITHNQG